MAQTAAWPLAIFNDAYPADSWVNLASCWKLESLQLVDSSVQTSSIPTCTTAVQVIEREDAGAQTGAAVVHHRDANASSGMQHFLNRTAPLMLEVLQDDTTSHGSASAEYESSSEEKPVCQYSLCAFPHDLPSDAQPEVTSVAWSCTGQTIAVGYGRHNITGWCTFHGAVATWNLSREQVNEAKPEVLIDVDSSVTACAFHPAHPALIASGTFNGVLHVWDLSQEGDMERGTSDSLAECIHLEPIKAIYWQYSMAQANRHAQASHAYRIITLGSEGKVLIWLWHKVSTPVYGYELSWPQPGLNRTLVWGATCMSFQRAQAGDATVFVVGTEGGTVFKCVLDYSELMSRDFPPGSKSSLRSVVKDGGYDVHAGALLGIDCSTHQGEVFATCGADGTLRVFNMLKKQSLMLLAPCSCPLTGVQWSPSRPLVLATTSSNGSVYVYDLSQDTTFVQPAATLNVNYGESPVHCLAFNHKSPGLLAAADSHTCQVWKLPPSLTNVRASETSKLKQCFGRLD